MSDCCYRTAHCNSVLAEKELQFILGGYIWLDMHGANVKRRQNDGYVAFICEIALNSFNKMEKKLQKQCEYTQSMKRMVKNIPCIPFTPIPFARTSVAALSPLHTRLEFAASQLALFFRKNKYFISRIENENKDQQRI